jgi:hypothetical protein
MDVHHHAHSTTSAGSRKKWTHYFWEFLMLFLAVFCGFLAENQREHIIEHKREKVFMESMVVDLGNDTARFNLSYHGIFTMIKHIDSLIPLLAKTEEIQAHANEIYRHQVWICLYYKVIYSDRTITQLKNSGNFRLIRKTNVSDAIIDYDTYVRNYVIQMQDDYLWYEASKLWEAGNQVFKSSVFRNWLKTGYKNNVVELPVPPYFLSAEKSKIDNYINHLQTYAVAGEWFLQNLKNAREQAEGLSLQIKETYHLK